jgi:hypothetical protein
MAGWSLLGPSLSPAAMATAPILAAAPPCIVANCWSMSPAHVPPPAVSTAFEELVLKIIEGPALTLGQHQQHQERVHMNGAQRTQAGSASSCMC